jgi:hypothetical protein
MALPDYELPADLLAYLQSEHERAFDPELVEARKIALEYYQGMPFGDEVDGRSQLVTRDVAEVIDYMTIAVMRVMIADKVVEFEPSAAGSEQAAKEATELVSWQFMRQQPGISILRDALIAGLKEKTGILKTWAEQREIVVEGLATDLNDETIIAAEETGEYDQDPVSGEVVPVYRVRRRVAAPPKFLDAAVPNEEFGFSPEARALDDAGYIDHRTRYTLWELADTFGLSAEEAGTFGDDVGVGKQLSDARDTARSYKDSDSMAVGMARMVWVEEEYVFWDWNGDGHAERIRVHRIGTKVLDVTPVDEQPFVIWCPFPSAHRIVGDSLADKTMDIQRVRSVLLRQAMDALYFANAPRSLIDTSNMDENTVDDILSIVPGAPIRYRGNAPQPWSMPFAAPHAFTALEFMTGERESRTGVIRHNQGLNPDTLNKTASGMAMIREAGGAFEEYIARNFAEAVAELFEKKLRLLNRYGAVAEVRVGGEFRQVDASALSPDMTIGIRVGLGTGNKDKRLEYRQIILGMQARAKDENSPLVDNQKLYNTAAGIVADMGIGDVNTYFNDPTNAPEEEAGKDPATIEAEGKIALAQQQQQFDQERVAAQIELERAKAEAQAELARAKAASDERLAREKAAWEAELAAQKFEFEKALAIERAQFEASMREQSAGLPDNRPGGRLDA